MNGTFSGYACSDKCEIYIKKQLWCYKSRHMTTLNNVKIELDTVQ